jgi:hypothetical protein
MGKIVSLLPPTPLVQKGSGTGAGMFTIITSKPQGQGGGSGTTYALRMPTELSDVFSADWSQEELSADFLNRLVNNITGGDTSGVGMDAFTEALEAIGLGGAAAQTLFNQRTAKNKNVALLFRNANLRQYQFSFDFMPISSGFASSVDGFIKDIRAAMHTSTASGQTFSYPDLFDVKILVAGKTVFNSQNAALTNLTVNPFASGGAAFHKDGYPVHTSVTLEFQEIQPLNRNKINELYQ